MIHYSFSQVTALLLFAQLSGNAKKQAMNIEAQNCFHQQDGERVSRVEYAYRKIKTNITNNNYPAGFQILEPELARVLGVSRTPVREALIRLEADKLIKLVPRRGMKVVPLSHTDVNELVEALTSFEVSAASLVCTRSEALDVSSLESKIRVMHESSSKQDKASWIAADEAFHMEFILLANNSRLQDVCLGLLSQIHRAKFVVFDFCSDWTNFSASNSELILALKQNRQAEAVSAIRRYHEALSDLFELARKQYKRLEF